MTSAQKTHPQLQINDVHIRYEDDISFGPGRNFACGFRVESLSARTSDRNFVPQFVHREAGEVDAYKMVALEKMSTYLDMDAELFGSLDTRDLEASSSCSKTDQARVSS